MMNSQKIHLKYKKKSFQTVERISYFWAMKEIILKRERVVHLLSLGLIAVSLFLKDPNQKMSVLVVGILGILLLSILKKQKILTIIYVVLLLAAGIFFYVMTGGKLS